MEIRQAGEMITLETRSEAHEKVDKQILKRLRST